MSPKLQDLMAQLHRDMERIFEDDKTEYELSDPRYIEALLDDDEQAND